MSNRIEMSLPDGTAFDQWKLFQAAAAGDTAGVNRMCEERPEWIHHQVWYEFPVHFAVRSGNHETVQALLDAGTNPARSNFNYHSWQKLLITAEKRGFDSVRDVLISAMYHRFKYDPVASQALWPLINQGDLDAISELLDAHPDWLNIGDVHGNRPIHWAVLSGQLKVINLLHKRGVDLKAVRADQQSALHISIIGDYWFRKNHASPSTEKLREITTQLLKLGADYEFCVAIALQDVAEVRKQLSSDPGLARQLNSSNRSPLFHASMTGNLQLVDLLMEYGADANLPESCAESGKALFIASDRNDIPMMKLLLNHGADPNAYVDSSGNCLSIARKEAEQDQTGASNTAMELLRKHGAQTGHWLFDTIEKISARLADATELEPACDIWSGIINQVVKLDDLDLLDQFVKRFGPEVIQELNPTHGWRTPKSAKMLDALMKLGMDINARDWYGRSCLHYAAIDNSIDRATELIERGIAINSVDHLSGTTALGIAAEAGFEDLVSWLLEVGANPRCPDRKWDQPMQIARRNGHTKIVETIRERM